MAIVAFDMGYHGEHYLHTERVDYQKVVGRNRADFIAKSEVAFDTVLAYVKTAKELDGNRVGMMSYSLGGTLTFYVANQHPEVRAMACMVLPNGRDKYDAYEPLRHQERLKDTSVLVVFATDDEYFPYDNSVWMYEQLTMTDKKMLSFQSGHSLPAEYVKPVFSWLRDRLLSARDEGEGNSDE
jgi:predicted peptidase